MTSKSAVITSLQMETLTLTKLNVLKGVSRAGINRLSCDELIFALKAPVQQCKLWVCKDGQEPPTGTQLNDQFVRERLVCFVKPLMLVGWVLMASDKQVELLCTKTDKAYTLLFDKIYH